MKVFVFIAFVLIIVFSAKAIAGINEWTYVGLSPERITDIAVHPTNPDIIYVSTIYLFFNNSYGGLFKTTDRGLTWDTLGFGHTHVYTIKIDQTNPDHIWIANSIFGIWLSTDAGETWVNRSDGLVLGGSVNKEAKVLSISPHNPAYLVCGTKDDNGPGCGYFSIDSAQSWHISTEYCGSCPSYLGYDFQTEGWTYAFFGSSERVWLSIDYGQSFEMGGAFDWHAGEYDFEASSTRTAELWLATEDQRVLKSINLGHNWVPIITDFVGTDTVIWNFDLVGDTMLLNTNFGSYLSLDGGSTMRLLYQNEIDRQPIDFGKIINTSPLELWVMRREQGIWSYTVDSTNSVSPLTVPTISDYSFSSYPNPFNSSTEIRYELPKQGRVKLSVYDILGREVRELVDGVESAREHSVVFEGKDLGSGIYFARIEITPPSVSDGQRPPLVRGMESKIVKMVMLK